MTKAIWACALIALCASGPAFAVCEGNPAAKCYQTALESADTQLNFVFKRLLTSATAEKEQQLRSAQRSWVQQRNATCKLGAALTQSADWLARLSREADKANCVHDATMSRVVALQDQPVANPAEEFADRTTLTFPASRRNGKWYAEVTLYVAGADVGSGPTTIVQAGVTTYWEFVGTQFDTAKVASKALPNGNYVIGMAIDLDNGKFYYAENGKWNAEPGSLGGSDLKRGQDYTVHVGTPGKLLSKFIQVNALHINTGNEPFQFATPAGYAPYHRSPTNIAGGSGLDFVVPIYKKVANKTLAEWVDRYWAWLMVKTPERSPVLDTTGEYCRDSQAGPVWFLASGDAKSNIVRSCTIPRGKFLLIPAIANVISVKAGSDDCARFEAESTAEKGADKNEAVFLSIDGQRFESFYDYRVFTRKCKSIRGDAGETVQANAIYFGTWILLQPLPAGDHTIAFGGRLDDLQVNRSVAYKLRVQ